MSVYVPLIYSPDPPEISLEYYDESISTISEMGWY